jgi:peptide chain release factor
MSDHILQISAGQGPLECQYFVPLLAEIIAGAAAASGLECLLLSNDEQKKVYRSSMRYLLRGTAMEEFRSQWCGTVQWIW